MKSKGIIKQMETVSFLFKIQKAQYNCLILLRYKRQAPIYGGSSIRSRSRNSTRNCGEKLSLKELFVKFFRTRSSGFVSSVFLAALLLFFAGKETLGKTFLTELYKNLMVELLFSDNDSTLEFNALTDLGRY